MLVSVALCGGLGNQLFQIFATIAYALRIKSKFVFCYTPILYSNTNRRTYFDDFLKNLRKYTTHNENLGITNADIYSNQFIPVNMPHHNYHAFPIDHTAIPEDSKLLLNGYYQSYKYFEHEYGEIRKMMAYDAFMVQTKRKYESLFQSTNHKISIHFRLGDYKKYQDCHNILGYNYYESAMAHMVNKLDGEPITILYFCEKEDNEYISTVIRRLAHKWNTIQFIKVVDEIEDWEQMVIMSCCDSHIIANSTFSWWGAFLNPNEQKNVCYPSVWFGPCLKHNYIDDMFPPGWVKINT